MNTRKRRADGETSRANILATALRLFRQRGFHETTMRDIASESGLSLGAAYYYFPSKEAIVLAYYDQVQERHEKSATLACTGLTSTRARLGAVMSTKIDLLKEDRSFLRAILRTTLDKEVPVSLLSQETSGVRSQSFHIFVDALACEDLPSDAKLLVAQALWALHLALLLYFVNDSSNEQTKTRELVDGSLDLVANIIPMLGSPMFGPFRSELTKLLTNAGIFDLLAFLESGRASSTG